MKTTVLSRDNGLLVIGERCRIKSAIIDSFNSKVNIGADSSFEHGLNLTSADGTIDIGDDCMASFDVLIRCGNGHNLFDMDNDLNLNFKEKKLVIGKHVWLGVRAAVATGADIGSGSVVGVNSFVNKPFPNNSCIAGNPARIVRKNVAWCRESRVQFESYDDFSEFDYRNEDE